MDQSDSGTNNGKVSRKDFIKLIGAGALSLGVANFIGIDKLISNSAFATQKEQNSYSENKNYDNKIISDKRVKKAFDIRVDAAKFERDLSIPEHPDNGDDNRYENRIASFSKVLPHNKLGEVDPRAYSKLLFALKSGDPTLFELIPMGGYFLAGTQSKYPRHPHTYSFELIYERQSNYLKLINPLAAFSFELIGPDSHHLFIRPPPTFDSPEEAGEMAELYWQAVVRDIAFTDYANHFLIRDACNDLSNFIFNGPKIYGKVLPETIFRGKTSGDLSGPYVSQFLLKDVPHGSLAMKQKYNASLPDSDYLISYHTWLSSQNGIVTEIEHIDTNTPRYIRNGRDLAECVHKDYPCQGFLNACLILLGSGAKFDSGNPYLSSITQSGFPTFGGPHVLFLLSSVANLALKAAWFQKWLVHRRLRPEAFGGCIHNTLMGNTNYPIHKDIMDSQVLSIIYSRNKSYLLPISFPEGCPAHPAYPGGHATWAGACATVVKAFFDEEAIIEDPVVPTHDGLDLLPYKGPDVLTVGGELNKLASNIGIGRDFAGIHWRSDAIEGMKLGEELAIRFLIEQKDIFYEKFDFSITKFDGTSVTI
jgi:hypothetical protein